MWQNISQSPGATATALLDPPDTGSRDPWHVPSQEEPLLVALRRGDEAAYSFLLQRYHKPMFRRALFYVSDPRVAEEVVQEAWMGIVQGLHRFEGRCTLRTWIFRILANCAQTRGVRESRYILFSSLPLSLQDPEDEEGAINDEMLYSHGQPSTLFQKILFYQQQVTEPEEFLLAKELGMMIQGALMLLPPRLRRIMTLRTIEGWTAEEVCHRLKISKENQRVLLHRARVQMRTMLMPYIADE